jgi:hypothetical protein
VHARKINFENRVFGTLIKLENAQSPSFQPGCREPIPGVTVVQRRLDSAKAMPPVCKLTKVGAAARLRLGHEQTLVLTCISMGTRSDFMLDLCAEMDRVGSRNMASQAAALRTLRARAHKQAGLKNIC